MHRDSRKRSTEGADPSPPTEAWLFAQALLGKPVPSTTRVQADATAKRKQLEWLAQISPRHAQELRRLHRAGSEARRKRELLEWLAHFSTEHESKLRVLLREEAEASDRSQRFIEASNLEEWDPSKHPRAGGPPNAGWWASTDGGDDGGGNTSVSSGIPVSGASYAGPKHVVAQQVAWPPPVGHHWVPVGVTQHPDIRPLLSDDATKYAAGAYSGPTIPPHGNGSYGGVSHPKYSAEVKKELKAFIARRRIQKMSAKQMETFAGLMKDGLDASGKSHQVIGPFNRAVKAMVPAGTTTLSKMNDIISAGHTYMKHPRFRLLAAGAVISGILGEVVAQQIRVLDVARSSGHYQQALQALQDGNLAKAHSLLIGDRDSLYHEILGRVGAHAALNFRTAIDQVFANAQKREYK